MTKLPLDWEHTLKKPEATCAATGRVFEPGDEYVSFLAYEPELGWQRREVAPEVFEALEDKPFAFWRHRVPMPEAKKQRPLDLNFLTEFFKRLQENREGPDHREVGYIVTLLLVRKKVLSQVGMASENGEEYLEVRFAKDKDGKVHRVLVPEIDGDKMEMIRDDLGRIFNLEDGAAAGPEEAAPLMDAEADED
ncbi:MAG: hypothetical protein H6807_05500 [Planctomycetes bacterium]|nr:hypothetical protein [Planctomycetota bacterium]